MRVAVIGAKGQLGHDVVRALSDHTLFPLTRSELDIRDFEDTHKVLGDIRPDFVINTAALTRVDDCEDEVSEAFGVNAFGPRHLAQICAAFDCLLVHISTDYVFGGEKRTPYVEDDAPNPLSAYGVSKLAGEYFVRTICPKHLVVRTSGLYGVAGSSGKRGNFVETMIRLAQQGKSIRVVNDQVLTPTYTRDVAEKIAELSRTDAYGIYHLTNDGHCSWYEFAARLFALLGLHPDFAPTTTAEFGAKARRPAYSVLAQDRWRELRLGALRPWPAALAAYCQEKGYL